MTDETTVLDEEVVDEAETEDETEVEAETDEDQDDDDTEDESDDEEVEEETLEFTFGGNKLAVPKGSIPDELAAEIDKFTKGTWSDYTKKSQAATESLKSLEARESAVERIETMQADVLDTYSRGASIKSQIAEITAALPELWQSNPDQARQYSDIVRQKEGELQRIASELSQKEAQTTKAQREETERRMSEGKALIERHIKDFNADAVVEYAVASGIPKEDAHKWPLNPVVAGWAHKAMLFDKAQAQAKAKPKPKPATPVTPMKTKSGQSKRFDAVRDADRLSADEWAARRNAQLAKR